MWCVFLAAMSPKVNAPIFLHYESVQETKDEYYEML